jgi:hypothetical protein
VQHDTAPADRDVSTGIRGEGKLEAFDEVASEFADELEAGAELAVERGPAYFGIVPDGMQPIREQPVRCYRLQELPWTRLQRTVG